MCRCSRIRELNDILRTTLFPEHGRVVITSGINALPVPTKVRISAAVMKFDDFNEDNDPYGEHDLGMVEVDGHSVMWRIAYYDKSLQFGSEDPSDPEKTTRVLTILLADEN